MRGVFLDISKGTLVFYSNYKLTVDGDFFSPLENYIEDCKQRVVLNGQTSDVEEKKFWRFTRIGIRASFVFNLHN